MRKRHDPLKHAEKGKGNTVDRIDGANSLIDDTSLLPFEKSEATISVSSDNDLEVLAGHDHGAVCGAVE
jgi:hypothetical protein